MRWLKRVLLRAVLESVRPVLRDWIFTRVLYLSDDDFRRLSGNKQEIEFILRSLYLRLRSELELNYDKLEKELLERI